MISWLHLDFLDLVSLLRRRLSTISRARSFSKLKNIWWRNIEKEEEEGVGGLDIKARSLELYSNLLLHEFFKSCLADSVLS